MILEKLPFPGQLSNGVNLRKEVCKAVSYAETIRDLSPDTTTPEILRQFFLDCAKLLEPPKKEVKK
jgi:hypothetical protein